jgi:hypothetical protein
MMPQKPLHLRIGAFGKQLPRVADGDLRLALRIQEYAVVTDREDARQLMRHHDDRRAQAVAQLEDQIVEQSRADRIEPGRGFVE